MAISVEGTTSRKNLLLLIQLRWLAVLGQIATILFVHFELEIPLPLAEMMAVIAFLVALNVVSFVRYSRRASITNTELFVELMMDVAALTLQLYLSGGASNPFTSLYLLQVIIAAVLLEAWSVWILLVVTSFCFAWLTVSYRDLMIPHHHGDLFSLHIAGMFICFVLAASLLVIFITRITRNLRGRDEHFARLRQQSAEEDLIVRMGLLASGAAHELSTPLSTLSVILNDWRRMPWAAKSPETAAEIEEMQTEVKRCKEIVSGILRSAGEARSEEAVRTTVNGFLDAIAEEWRTSRSPAAFVYEPRFDPDEPIVSDLSLKQVIFNLLDNALEASPQWVGLEVQRDGLELCLAVTDRGRGFDKAMLDTLGRPYRSTKATPGSGLGLFLVVNVVRKLGGVVTAENHEEGGAAVRLRLPLEAISMRMDRNE